MADEVQVGMFLEIYEHRNYHPILRLSHFIFPNQPSHLRCPSQISTGIKRFIIKDLSSNGHLPNFRAHCDFLGGSDISKDDIFWLPFSTSKDRTLGVGGTSSILLAPLVDLICCTSFGNADLLGVKAVATLFADLLIVLRTSHDRFLARYQSTDEATI